MAPVEGERAEAEGDQGERAGFGEGAGGVECGDDRAVADGFDPKQINRTLG